MEQHLLDKYNSTRGAISYRGKFQRHWNERLNNQNEQRLLRRLLARLEPVEDALDLPCGYGRLYPAVQKKARRVVECDWSFHLLREAQGNPVRQNGAPRPLGFVRATAMQLPYRERAFGLVLSVRLSHHIASHEERLAYLREILRVSSRYVVLTHFDTDSLKNHIHRAKLRYVSKRPKYTLSQEDITQTAAAMGFRVRKSIPLARLFSGHRYVLLERLPAKSR